MNRNQNDHELAFYLNFVHVVSLSKELWVCLKMKRNYKGVLEFGLLT